MLSAIYSSIMDMERFQKVPTMLLLIIFQYLGDDGLFIMNYDKNTKDLRICVNKNHPILTKSLIYKQLNPPQHYVYYYHRFTHIYNEMMTVTDKVLYISVPDLGKLRENFNYNDQNIIIYYHNMFYSSKKKRRYRHRYH